MWSSSSPMAVHFVSVLVLVKLESWSSFSTSVHFALCFSCCEDIIVVIFFSGYPLCFLF